MKKIIQFTIALGLMVFSTSLQAQECHKGKGHKGRMEMMRTNLDLSDAQAAQMESLNAKYRPQIKALKADETMDQETRRTKIHAIHEAKKADVKAILSPEQLVKLEEMHKGRGKGNHGEFRGKGRKGGVHAELKPIMQRQRAKLEAQLTEQDKSDLAVLRGRMKAQKQESKAFRKEMHANRKAGTQPTEAQKAQKEAFKKQREAIRTEVLTIAQRYESQLKTLHEEVKPEIEAIMAKHAADRPACEPGEKCEKGEAGKGADGKCTKGEGKRRHGQKGHHGPRGAHGAKGHGHDGKLVHFMLLDPNATATGKSGQSLEQGKISSALSIYPNPSSGSNTLRYELPTDGNVKVELLSIDGQVIRILDEGRKPAGEQTLQISLSDLSAGIYFYRVSGDVETMQGRFSVTK